MKSYFLYHNYSNLFQTFSFVFTISIYLGKFSYSYDKFFKGRMKRIVMFNESLTESEINDIDLNGLDNYSNVVVDYQFNEGEGFPSFK